MNKFRKEIWNLFPTFDVGWGCGHTDTFTINVKKQIKKLYTIEKYCNATNTYLVSEICPFCEEQIRKEQKHQPL